MKFIAVRPEYQLAVEPDKNRVFYQNFGAMQTATQLPFYLTDWQLTLQEVRPGFTILADLEFVNRAQAPSLPPVFQAAEELLRLHGVQLVAEVHVPGDPTHLLSDEVNIGRLPVRSFLRLWEAAQYLDELHAGPPEAST